MTRLLLRCPLCGAQIESLEEEHVVSCTFCSSKLLASVRGGSPAYTLPPKILEPQRIRFRLEERIKKDVIKPVALSSLSLTHLPFWRVQAVSYRWIFGSKIMGKGDPMDLLPPPKERVRELVVRPMDHTICASRACGAQTESLGVRTQVLPLSPLAPGEKDRSLLPVELGRKAALEALEKLIQSYPQPPGVSPEMVLESLVGLKLTLIYLPVWRATFRLGEDEQHYFLDGVDGRFMGKSSVDEPKPGSAQEEAQEPFLGEIKLLPFRCPNCGWDLPFRPSSLLHLCPTCLRLWTGYEGGWREMPYEVALPPGRRIREDYLWVPFWCFRCRYTDGRKHLESASELRRLAVQAPGPRLEFEKDEPAILYVPAIRFPDPKVSMGLAVRITGAQPSMEMGGFSTGVKVDSSGGSLSVEDAKQMALPILAGLVPFRNRELLKWLAGVKADLGEARVRFLPFIRKDIFWMELHTKTTFPHNPRCADLVRGRP